MTIAISKTSGSAHRRQQCERGSRSIIDCELLSLLRALGAASVNRFRQDVFRSFPGLRHDAAHACSKNGKNRSKRIPSAAFSSKRSLSWQVFRSTYSESIVFREKAYVWRKTCHKSFEMHTFRAICGTKAPNSANFRKGNTFRVIFASYQERGAAESRRGMA